jgi:peptidoglycan/LPS O-acetylase OafA/YrhL
VPIFWTLAIEAQFYLLIGLSLPLLVKHPPWPALAVMALWILAPLVAGHGPTVFTWTALFALGIVVFLYRASLLSLPWAASVFAAAGVVELSVHGWASAFIGVGTAVFIAFCPGIHFRALVAIGTISYSLYLIHPLIGGRVINFTSRLPDQEFVHWLALTVAVLLSLAAAAVLYYVIEKPSHVLSRRFRPGVKNA